MGRTEDTPRSIHIAPRETRHMGLVLGEAAIATLRSPSFFGLGELRGGKKHNNRSPQIDFWRANDGTGKGPGGSGSWCAVAASAAQRLGARDAGLIVPWKPSRGAKALTRNLAGFGSWAAVPSRIPQAGPEWRYPESDVPPGSLIAWHRGPPGRPDLAWQGHVETWLNYDPTTDSLTTICANVNNRTDANGLRYAVIDYRIHAEGSWRRRLYGVASPL